MPVEDPDTETPRWREETGGTFVAETGEFVMKVHTRTICQHIHFTVLKRSDVQVGLGISTGVRSAMIAAEMMAAELAAIGKNAGHRLGSLPPPLVPAGGRHSGAFRWNEKLLAKPFSAAHLLGKAAEMAGYVRPTALRRMH